MAIALALIPAQAFARPAASGPFSLDSSALVDILGVAAGGVRHGTRVIARGDLVLDYDGSSGGISSLSGELDVTGIAGRSISALAGDVQGVSSNEYAPLVRATNAWLQARGSHAAVKFGIIDSNVDFDEQHVGAAFVNASHGAGPEFSAAGLDGNGATPNTTLGIVASLFDAEKGWKLRAGLFNGRPSDPADPARPGFAFSREIGVLAIGEADLTRDWGRIVLGGWHFTSELPSLDGGPDRRGASGGFVTLEPNLIRCENGLQLQGWLRLGIGDARTDLVRGYIGGGLVASGFWRKFPEDTVGFAVAQARLNDRAGPGAGAETTLEWTLQHQVHHAVTLQPDVQWVINPGGFGGIPDALVAGMRVIFTQGIF